ncbi:hypothetical protein SUGI_0246290 [Cryptomeria japonica]|uniref:uncharacterized protein LOC131027641 n=1 Tax=Cryptomeria japonica TaxID=3369 RepID=UPI002408C068|nr:uncharacterized protein LOC131027641 [Cryptomeria japonica]GLJ15069.1 hypothetical protein SUGI_0246290 [Cryptomeria japonica]
MGQFISLIQSKKSLSETTEEPTERCPSSLSCGSILDLDNNLFICNLLKDDPNGYSSRVYYRSGLGTGVPFTWEAEPGKPKTNSMEESDFIVVPPPPPFEGDKKLTLLQVRNKDRGSKSWRRIPCASVGCIPF